MAKDASQFPITFGYGATDDTYYGPKAQGKSTYIGPYHKGDDREMDVGTPVVVNGVQIGLSGSGNGRYGPHLHVGRFVNGADTNPNGGGFSLNGAKVVTVVDNYSTDPVNAKYVRIQDSIGANWVYLHMSQINVSVGQVLEGGDVPASQDKIDDTVVRLGYNIAFFRQPSDEEIKHWVGTGYNVEQFMRVLLESQEHSDIGIAATQGKTKEITKFDVQEYIDKHLT